MNKIILVFCAVLAVATGLPADVGDWTVSELYMAPNEEEYSPIVDKQLKRLKSLYAQRKELIHYVNNTEIDLYESDDICVEKYRSLMPTIDNVTQSMNTCIKQADDGVYLDAVYILMHTMTRSYEPFYHSTEECRQKFLFGKINEEDFFSCVFEKVQENDANLRLNKKPSDILQDKVQRIEESVAKAVECCNSVKKETESKVTTIGEKIKNCVETNRKPLVQAK